MAITRPYEPDYATPPGSTLEEVLEDLEMTQADLARRTDLSTKHINRIIQGHAAISAETALRLERVTGIPARIWNNLESRYQEQRLLLAEPETLAADLDLLEALPVNSMVAMGLLSKRTTQVERLREVLRFFGVASKSAWETTWSRELTLYRKSQVHESSDGAIAVWLRLGEIRASAIPCRPWNPTAFRDALVQIRRLTRETDPGVWGPELVELCAASGVALAVTPQVRGARANGAARWLGPERALIQLSLRHKWSDIFWFTFFHEAKHVLDESKTSIYVESTASGAHRDSDERAADAFAADFLIPRSECDELRSLKSLASIERFAERLEIHPGIVVGRLQHDGLWARTHGNGVRQRLELTGSNKYRDVRVMTYYPAAPP